MADIPAGAQRSPDGNYWWDDTAGAWQLIEGGPAADPSGSAGSSAGAASAAPAAGAAAATDAAAGAAATPPARTGSISIELGVVAEDSHSHDEVVAMVERGGAQLPQGEAYA